MISTLSFEALTELLQQLSTPHHTCMFAFVLQSSSALTHIKDTVRPHAGFLYSPIYPQMSTKVCKLYSITNRKDFAIIQISESVSKLLTSVLWFPHLQNKTNRVVIRIRSNYLCKAFTTGTLYKLSIRAG